MKFKNSLPEICAIDFEHDRNANRYYAQSGMLIAENQMDDADGHYVDHPNSCLAFHLSCALHRLGKKVVSLKQETTDNTKALTPIYEAPSLTAPSLQNTLKVAYFCFDPYSIRNQAVPNSVFEDTLKRAQALKRGNPQAQFVFILPRNTPHQQIEKLRQNLERVFVFLSPTLWGFRDEHLFEALLHNTTSMWPSWRPNVDQCDLLFIPDAVGFLIGALNRSNNAFSLCTLPSSAGSLSDFIAEFRRTFRETSTWKRILGKSLPRNIPILLQPSTQEESPEAPSALDLFPTAIQSPERALRSCHHHLKNQSIQKMHFPPSKGL